MSPSDQQIAIAEVCGWKPPFIEVEESIYGVAPNWDNKTLSMISKIEHLGEDVPRHIVPDYLNDLNAMHEAEKVLDEHQRKYFTLQLMGDVIGTLPQHYWRHSHATAAQRAEAFLRTIGKWEAQS